MDRIIDNKRYTFFSSLYGSELKKMYKDELFHFFFPLVFEYRGFYDWYNNLFDEKCNLKTDREIIICEVDYVIAGVAVLKKNTEEVKLCTLRVSKKFRNQGIAHQLMELSFEQLGTEKPMFTLHKRKLPQFKPLFDHYGFQIEQSRKHYYGFFNTELVYNGTLPKKNFFIDKIKIQENLDSDFLMNNINIFELLKPDIERKNIYNKRYESEYMWVMK